MTIQDDYLRLRQQAEAQAFKEYDDRYASARSPSASYRDVIGLVQTPNGPSGPLSIGQGLDTGRLFRNNYADTNRDGKISGDEIKTLAEYDHRDLLQAAMVMERVNTLIANPSQIVANPTRLPDETVLQQRLALEQSKNDHELRQYIVDGTSKSYDAFTATDQPKEQTPPDSVLTAQSLKQLAANLPDLAMLHPVTQPLGALATGAMLAANSITKQVSEPTPTAELAGPPAETTQEPKPDVIFAATESPVTPDTAKATNDLIAYTGTVLKGDNGKEFTGVLFKGVHQIDPKFAGQDGLVAQLQRDLKELKLYEGEIDGKFGPITEAAVKKFQKENGLEDSGYAGKETVAALQIQQLVNLAAKDGSPEGSIQKESLEAHAALGNFAGIVPDSLKTMMTKVGLEHHADATVRLASVPDVLPTGRATVPD